MTFNERIRAIFIVQRFVRMSRQLLPVFSELLNKKALSSEDKANRNRIEELYDNFEADPEVTMNLINSNIIGLIQESFKWLKNHRGKSPLECDQYCDFIDESDRLIEEWEYANLN